MLGSRLQRFLNNSVRGFLSAGVAESIDLEAVARGLEFVLLADLLFYLFDLGRKKLDRSAAVRTDHVVMAAAPVLMLVSCHPVVERNLAG